MRHRTSLVLALPGLFLLAASPGRTAAQGFLESQHYISFLEQSQPDTYELLIRLERAHGVMFGGLAKEGEAVRATGGDLPTFEFEFDMVNRLTDLVHQDGTADDVAGEAEAGFGTLGPEASAIIEHGNAFYREVLGILADTALVGFADRREAVAAAVDRYESRSEVALPAAPKNMDVLYEHPQNFDFRSGYADLDGLLWAGQWFRLAATEPFTDLEGAERAAGLDTVEARYYSKLTYGEAPEFFPIEIPLAPAIAPSFVAISPEAAMIWDNLTMFVEVLGDILASPDVADVPEAINNAVDFFVHPTFALTSEYDWQLMALRHGIFFQGGYPLTVMTESELNVGGHAAHILTGSFEIVTGMGGG